MHDHHGAAGANLLPPWVQVLWVLVMAAITATHAVHLLTMRGQARAWHLTHLVMGVGMLYMFAPWAGSPGSARAWQYLFAAMAIGVGGWIAARLQRGDAVNALWFAAAIGMAAMAYMFLTHRGSGAGVVTYTFVAYYLAEAAGWAHGWFAETLTPGVGFRRRSALPFAVGPARPAEPAAPLAGRGRWDVSASQCAMAVAMGYMFLAMDDGARRFFAHAFTAGAVTEQTMWACALLALTVLACVPCGPAVRPQRERAPASSGAAGAGAAGAGAGS